MLELIHSGTPNIVCTQPFGCLPNHIVGKGMVRRLKDDYPDSNIVAIDYDPGATKINQENRIKLMLANAKRRAAEEKKADQSAAVSHHPPMWCTTETGQRRSILGIGRLFPSQPFAVPPLQNGKEGIQK